MINLLLIVKDCQKFRTLLPCTVASPHQIFYTSIILSYFTIIIVHCYNRVQKLLRQAVYWPSPSCNNGSCPPPLCNVVKTILRSRLINNMFSTLLMGGGGHAPEKDHQNVKESHYFCTRLSM